MRPSSPLKKSALANADTNIVEALGIPPPAKPVVTAVQEQDTSSQQQQQPIPPKASKASLKPSTKSSKRSSGQKHASTNGKAAGSEQVPPTVNGVTLQIGIPCMISSKRSRFKAFARYIGELAGEDGPWVGVEVPVSESWTAERLDGRDWNDGSVAGVRYFEIGSNSPQLSVVNSMVLEEGEERAARRRRVDAVVNASTQSMTSSLMGNAGSPGSIPGSGPNSARFGSLGPQDAISISSFGASSLSSPIGRRKREGESLTEQERLKRLRSTSPVVSEASSFESRGLFVRPTQVLLVMDAPEHR